MTMPRHGNNTRFAIHVSGACPPCDDLYVQFRAVVLAPIGAGPVWDRDATAMKSDDDDDPWAQCRPNMDTTAAGVPGWRGYKLAWDISTNGFGSESRENLSGLWTISPSNATDTLYPPSSKACLKRGQGTRRCGGGTRPAASSSSATCRATCKWSSRAWLEPWRRASGVWLSSTMSHLGLFGTNI